MRRSSVCLLLSSSLLSLAFARTAQADTLSVKAGTTYDTPCKAIAAAKAGDTIEIAAGNYTDACKVPKSLTIKGVGGRPVISAPMSISNGKGIFAIEGSETDVTIENVELAKAKVSDENGAGIRAQGRNLTVRNCVLRENENGVLGGEGGTITIENSTFDRNGDGKGYAHNVYIGTAKKLVFRGNYSRAAKSGHLLKSRAQENVVLANRLTGEAEGTQSYEADFPNGGKVLFAFNLVQQGTNTENPNILAYGMENLSGPVNELTVVHNTFVNGRGKGNETFVSVKDAFKGTASIVNNIFQGGGKITSYAAATLSGNLEGDGGLVDTAGFDFHLKAGSNAKDKGVDASSFLGGQALLAYVHPADDAPRTNVGAPDAGAYELGDTGAGGGGAGGSGAGGTNSAGSGGTNSAGTGGTNSAGTGGTNSAGTGGTSSAGTGGTNSAGTGGTSAAGTGGTSTAGTGGTSTAGTGGTNSAGTGGTQASAGSAGAKASAGNAGSAGSKASAGAAGAAPTASPTSSEDEGCGCRTAGQPTNSAPPALAFAALALAALFRRRRLSARALLARGRCFVHGREPLVGGPPIRRNGSSRLGG